MFFKGFRPPYMFFLPPNSHSKTYILYAGNLLFFEHEITSRSPEIQVIAKVYFAVFCPFRPYMILKGPRPPYMSLLHQKQPRQDLYFLI